MNPLPSQLDRDGVTPACEEPGTIEVVLSRVVKASQIAGPDPAILRDYASSSEASEKTGSQMTKYVHHLSGFYPALTRMLLPQVRLSSQIW